VAEVFYAEVPRSAGEQNPNPNSVIVESAPSWESVMVYLLRLLDLLEPSPTATVILCAI